MTTAQLLTALSHDDDWFERGRCVQADADVYFAREGEMGHSEREDRAKEVCAHCPVLAECLKWSLSMDGLSGVWAGGTNTAERLAAQRIYDIAG